MTVAKEISMDLRETVWSGMDWIDLAQERDQWTALVNTVLDHLVSLSIGKFLSSCATGGFSRRDQLHGVSVSETCVDVASGLHRIGQVLKCNIPINVATVLPQEEQSIP
jgi:hypothetical protein